jgi:hypothetical protein
VGITQRAYLESVVAFCGGGGDYYNEFSPDSHVSAGRFYSTRHIEDVAIYLWSYTQGVGLVLEASRNIYLGCP